MKISLHPVSEKKILSIDSFKRFFCFKNLILNKLPSIVSAGVQVHHTKMDPQVVDAYRKKELVRVEQKLDEYDLICRRQMGQKVRLPSSHLL